jgi:hypothetical protein
MVTAQKKNLPMLMKCIKIIDEKGFEKKLKEEL